MDTNKTFPFIDFHEDIAFNTYCMGRDYATSAQEIRIAEEKEIYPEKVGYATLGWKDWQKANTAAVFGTLFSFHRRYVRGGDGKGSFRDHEEAKQVLLGELDVYHKMACEHADKFTIITNSSKLKPIWNAADKNEAHQMGIVLSIEGAEGFQIPEDAEFWYEQGVRFIGPVWAGGRFCGGTIEHGGFTDEGRRLLAIMADLGMGLDLSHMTDESALEALDRYEGPIVASHGNVRSLVKGYVGERHFTDQMIRRLAERGGVMGVIPFNNFLDLNWTNSSARDTVTMSHLVDHIDHVCQLTGSADHVAIGSDFDGGFGYPSIPFEFNTIADIQKLSGCLADRGYREEEIRKIFGENIKSALERILPE